MAKKRKADRSFQESRPVKSTKFDIEETFNDSEDEFYAARDKISFDEGPEARRRNKRAEQDRDIQQSDEEILEYNESGDEIAEDESAFEQSNDEAQEEEDEHWGTSRGDYYDADVIETEADALEEEAEAKRLQQKQLKGMTEADFGFDDFVWQDDKAENGQGKSIIQKLPEAQLPEGVTDAQKYEILGTRHPEFEPLARDFIGLQATLRNLDSKVSMVEKGLQEGGTLTHGFCPQMKRQVLATYLGTIAMYIAVLSSDTSTISEPRRITSLPPAQLREHAVIDHLARARRSWDRVKGVDTAEVLAPTHGSLVNGELQSATQKDKVRTIQTEEVERLHKTTTKTSKPQASGQHEDRVRGNNSDRLKLVGKKSQKKRSRDRLDLQALLSQSAEAQDQDSDLGDEAPLTEEQAAEKAKKRKSLRFYSSQIAQKANKRGNASREAGGDDDLPHKERLRDRQERLLQDAESRGRAQANQMEQLGDEAEVDDEMASQDDGNDYYQSLLSRSKSKKAEKKARANAYAEAARQGAQIVEEESVGPDGKRAITYAIEKNKGLTPKRKKEVRNPRVKKRKKFDEKLKKLSSVRQVYKGGEGRGGYGGELTGIKSNIIKSVKL